MKSFTTRTMLFYLPALTTIALAAAIRSASWLNCDVSWLITVCEKLLVGARPYVDFDEPNPPASFLIYMPAAVMGRLIGAAPELLATLLIFAGAVLSLWLSGRILAQSKQVAPSQRPALFAAGCAMLLILPADTFGQREHIALISILPMLAVYSTRATGASVRPAATTIAGLGGGLAIAIKPHFALALIFPLAYAAWNLRKNRAGLRALILSPEHFAALLIVLGYAALVIFYFAIYFQEIVPLVLTLYVSSGVPRVLLLGNPSIILVASGAIVVLVLGRDQMRNPLHRVASLAVLGFTAALLIQAKGFNYHGYPAIGLGMLLLFQILLTWIAKLGDKPEGSRSRRVVYACAGLLLFIEFFALEYVWFLQGWNRVQYALVPAVARLVPAHPKVFAFAGGPQVAFPLTRILKGTSLGPTPFQWVSDRADRMLASDPMDLATRRRIEDYARVDRVRTALAVRTFQPDVILVEGKLREDWAHSHREIAAVLSAYRRVRTVDDIEIWLRIPATGRHS